MGWPAPSFVPAFAAPVQPPPGQDRGFCTAPAKPTADYLLYSRPSCPRPKLASAQAACSLYTLANDEPTANALPLADDCDCGGVFNSLLQQQLDVALRKQGVLGRLESHTEF